MRQVAAGQSVEVPRPINLVALIVLVALGLVLLSCITPMFLALLQGL
jgi:hypothetical protein